MSPITCVAEAVSNSGTRSPSYAMKYRRILSKSFTEGDRYSFTPVNMSSSTCILWKRMRSTGWWRPLHWSGNHTEFWGMNQCIHSSQGYRSNPMTNNCELLFGPPLNHTQEQHPYSRSESQVLQLTSASLAKGNYYPIFPLVMMLMWSSKHDLHVFVFTSWCFLWENVTAPGGRLPFTSK